MLKNKNKKVISVVSALTLALSFGLSASANAAKKEMSIEQVISKAQKKINTSKMMHDLKKLAPEDDARVVGFEGEKEAAQYMVKEFKKYGIKADMQEFKVGKNTTTEISDLYINGESIGVKASTKAASTDDLNGEVVYANAGSKEDFEAIDVNGKIAFVNSDSSVKTNDKVLNATKSGAIGVIYQYSSNTRLSAPSAAVDIPVVSIFNDDGEVLKSQLTSGETVNAQMSVKIVVTENPTSWNVVGVIPASKNPEKADTIIVGAHFDSISTPGANDNGSGTAVLLEVARLLSDKSLGLDLKYNIEFVGFGAEEVGLVGSKLYVEQLKSLGRVDNIKGMVNLDMVGVGDTISFNYTHVKGENGELLRQEVNEIGIKYAKKYNYAYQYEASSGSDHESFERAGIPTSYLEYLVDLPGEGNYVWAPYYHTDRDNIESIDQTNLYNMANVLFSMVLDMQTL